MMMRPITFRAWDKGQKRFVIIDLDHQLRFGEGGEFHGFEYRGGHFSGRGFFNLQQFTGLLDKNGEEIYEGDIVCRMKERFDDTRPEGEEEYKEREVSFIEYSHHGFWVHAEDFGWEGEGLWRWDTIEVIGNIYENPELLETKKSDEREYQDTTLDDPDIGDQ